MVGCESRFSPTCTGICRHSKPGAYWALLGPTVQLRRTAYDIDVAVERIACSGYPDAAGWADEDVVNPYGDMAALEAFTALVDKEAIPSAMEK